MRALLNVTSVFCASLSLVAQAQDADPGLIRIMDEKGKAGFEKYLSSTGPSKAFAVCANGGWSWVSKQSSPEKAAEAVLDRARRNADGAPCQVYSVDGQFASGTASVRTKEDAFKVLTTRSPVRKSYWEEDKDTNIPAATSPSVVFHAPTPKSVLGAKTLLTEEVKTVLSAPNRPLLVNVLNKPKVSIPGSLVVNFLGTDFTRKGETETEEFLSRHLKDKDAPVIFYCLSWECWLSYNAAMRAVALGYKNVGWYRGGIYSWFDAGLPVVVD
jgi:PQQ-dependent catabolism-associated CXXCW motif protein